MTGLLQTSEENDNQENSLEHTEPVQSSEEEMFDIVNFDCPDLQALRANVSRDIGKFVICLSYGNATNQPNGSIIRPYRAICEDGTAHVGELVQE